MALLSPSRARARQQSAANEHQCPQCNNLYSRRDHLIRHMRSHQKQRPLRCLVCGRGFSRSACHPCAVAKARCNDQKPCPRCQERGIECVDSPRHHLMDKWGSFHSMTAAGSMRSRDSTLVGTEIPNSDGMQLLMEGLSTQMTQESLTSVNDHESLDYIREHTQESQFTNPCTTTTPRICGSLESRGDDLNIQSEALIGQGSLLMDAGFDPSCNKSGPFSSAIFARHIEERTESLYGESEMQIAFQKFPLHSRGNQETCLSSSISRYSTVFSESECARPLSGKMWPMVPQIFGQRIRDALLAIVAREQRLEAVFLETAEFPSAASMDILADRFLRKQNRKLDSWFHTATFDPATAPADLTFMVLAAGALGSQVSNLRQWGYKVCRFMRRRLLTKLEDKNDALTALPLLQALLICLEVNSWNCDSSYLFHSDSLSDTMRNSLRMYSRYGAFPYEPVAPQDDDQGAELQSKWDHWIISEGFKRLAARFCTFENQKAAALSIRPSRASSDLRICLPHPRSLWMARTALEWKEKYLALPAGSTPKLKDLLASLPISPFPSGFFDESFAIKTSAHFLEGLITDHHLLSGVFNHPIGECDQQTESWKKDIKAAIENLRNVLRIRYRYSPATKALSMLTISYLYMILSVCVDDLELLFGKDGVEESQKKYRNMQDWPHTEEAREAIWHAGQILRHLRYIERPLSAFIVVMTYQAGLVLLGYLHLRNQMDDMIDATAGEHAVVLNGVEVPQSGSFVQHGVGKLTLQYDFQKSRPTVSPMTPQVVLQVVMESLFDTALEIEQAPQLLINGLLQLLRDIASGNMHFRADPRKSLNRGPEEEHFYDDETNDRREYSHLILGQVDL